MGALLGVAESTVRSWLNINNRSAAEAYTRSDSRVKIPAKEAPRGRQRDSLQADGGKVSGWKPLPDISSAPSFRRRYRNRENSQSESPFDVAE